MWKILKEDICNIYENDPAARNCLEIIFCYPGFQAIVLHRISHCLWKWHIPFFPRFLSYLIRIITGIDIHPGAVIGRRCFIDHGTGIVIGETTIIGEDVLIYQQVTLGGTGKDKGKRHPTIGDHVILGAGAKVLGNITIGDHVRIGAGSVVVENVPAYSTVVGVPGHIVKQASFTPEGVLQHNRIPDPVTAEINKLKKEIEQLKKEIHR